MTISDQDILFLGDCVREAARAEIMPRFRNLGAADVSEKTSAIDLVTQADVLAEHRITAALRERFPAALVVGEEAYDADRSVVLKPLPMRSSPSSSTLSTGRSISPPGFPFSGRCWR